MALFQSLVPNLVDPPDDFSVPQFLLDEDCRNTTRPSRNPQTPCIIDDETGRSVFLDELRSRTQNLAAAIHVRGAIRDGDVVSIFSPNHIDYPVCIWAVHRLGGVVATISPTLTSSELVDQLQIAQPSLLFTHVDSLATAIQACVTIKFPSSRIIVLGVHHPSTPILFHSVDDLILEGNYFPHFIERTLVTGEARSKIAFLAFSSGTTGKPKAVAISHFNVISIIIQVATFNHLHEEQDSQLVQRFRPGDVCSGFLPLYHIYGLVFNLHFMIYAGMTLVLAPKFNFEAFLSSIERYRITHLPIVPPQAVLLCKHPAVKNYDLSSVRYCIVAAAPLRASLTKKLLEVLPNVHLGQGYGMTETTGTVSMFPPSQKVGTLGSGGQLLPGTTAKVVKADGTLAEPGEPGELYVQGGQVTLGYYNDENATNESFRDGWLRTGDQCIFSETGDIFIIDRIKELIKVKGFQVAPAELEGHLLGHSDVADAAVIGVHDDFAGELPFAFIVLQPGVTAAMQRNPGLTDQVRWSIFKHVSEAKSKFKWLTGGIEFIESIPKNASGKILRRVLRHQANSCIGLRPKL